MKDRTYDNNGNVSSDITDDVDWRLLFGMDYCNPVTSDIITLETITKVQTLE